MKSFEPGQPIGIPCDVTEGAFPGEVLVTFETLTGTVSGFVRPDEVTTTESGTNYLQGIIKEVSEDKLTVWVKGSFFTTTGLAYISKDTEFMAFAA